jgi:hypothetical protein
LLAHDRASSAKWRDRGLADPSPLVRIDVALTSTPAQRTHLEQVLRDLMEVDTLPPEDELRQLLPQGR